MENIIRAAIRQQALYIPLTHTKHSSEAEAFSFLKNISTLGFTVSENALHALKYTNPVYMQQLYAVLCEVTGIDSNWTPLVKGWDIPTGESYYDHLATWAANTFHWRSGTQLPCGHIIPEKTFPLHRYNGCPYCGTPFQFEKLTLQSQGSTKKMLTLWQGEDAKQHLKNLLISKTALDATQKESLEILLDSFGLPEVQIAMKETLAIVIDYLIKNNQAQKTQSFFQSPADVLRYLWYKHTGYAQLIEPKVLLKRKAENNRGYNADITIATKKIFSDKADLKLKFSRTQCRQAAEWLNNINLPVEKSCEIMHPKRGVWVRMIRALRLTEYAKKEGFENLKALLHEFYEQNYFVWQGALDKSRNLQEETQALTLLKQRPGAFARALFANILWFGTDNVITAFKEIADKVPARLLFTLNTYTKLYFEKGGNRLVKPLGGYPKNIEKNKRLKLYNEEDRVKMQESIEALCLQMMKKRFEKQRNTNKTIYIEQALYKIPVSIGDRSETVQDLPTALMGTIFTVEGDTVRLFMQWGKGLEAQHLDMDLSAYIIHENEKVEICSFSHLVPPVVSTAGIFNIFPTKLVQQNILI